jgi:hypothetical protein
MLSTWEETKTEIRRLLYRNNTLDGGERGTFLPINRLKILVNCKAWPTLYQIMKRKFRKQKNHKN